RGRSVGGGGGVSRSGGRRGRSGRCVGGRGGRGGGVLSERRRARHQRDGADESEERSLPFIVEHLSPVPSWSSTLDRGSSRESVSTLIEQARRRDSTTVEPRRRNRFRSARPATHITAIREERRFEGAENPSARTG